MADATPTVCARGLHRQLQLVEVGEASQLAGLEARVPRFYVCTACGWWSQARVFSPPTVQPDAPTCAHHAPLNIPCTACPTGTRQVFEADRPRAQAWLNAHTGGKAA